MRLVLVSFVVACALTAVPHYASAADARAPYKNIDKSVDAGNATGDDKIDALNAAQLNQNYWAAAKQPGAVPNPPTTYTIPPR